ncbi:hypothetical protein J6590_040487 [Homalodisca vitripennis]|nr:hypothetical protein J6590_040487 [Homalodisca vitripennis]
MEPRRSVATNPVIGTYLGTGSHRSGGLDIGHLPPPDTYRLGEMVCSIETFLCDPDEVSFGNSTLYLRVKHEYYMNTGKRKVKEELANLT